MIFRIVIFLNNIVNYYIDNVGRIFQIRFKKKLTPEEFEVCVNRGTEPPFSGNLLNNKENGVYTCKCCGSVLFDSNNKYDSKSGWPSFWAPSNNDNIQEKMDYDYGMIRKEVVCSKCGCHLGHLFDDGPNPTGLRYCINSLSLNFKKKFIPTNRKDESLGEI